MFRFLIIFILLVFSITNTFALTQQECNRYWDYILKNTNLNSKYHHLAYKCDDEFRRGLREIVSTNKDLGYRSARHIMFSDLNNDHGQVCGVYTNFCIYTDDIPDHTVMNCEHSWPQSQGATGIAKSDLHHLFPSNSRVNSRRSNHPFCEVKYPRWTDDGSALGEGPSGDTCFEPRNRHKGVVARAMLYFAVRYDKRIDYHQEAFFKKWNHEAEPEGEEEERNWKIKTVQGNTNPFVEHPEFAYLIEDF